MHRNYQYMEQLPMRKGKRVIEPVDEWLQNENYYRKHAPKDATCLFRAISEQVYHSQRSHGRVRQECIDFIREHRHTFEEKISIPLENYLNQLACFNEWGGMNEILAMSLMYKRNVIIFHGQKLTKETAIDHGYQDNFLLCFTPPKQYETVYTQEYTSNAGFCQSIIYQLLYKNVFKMTNIDATVYKMLHERNNQLRHDKFFLKGNVEIRNQLTVELLNKLEEDEDSEEMQLLSKGITPFPYRVAKALDPNIYRNIDYDIWHEIRKEMRHSGYIRFNSSELQIGAKCLVQIDAKESDKVNNNLTIAKDWDNSKAVARLKGVEPLYYTGHIQEMSKNQGPVLVFIEELGEKLNVAYECLKPFPSRKLKQNNWPITNNKRNMINQNNKWKKPWNTTNRKVKDQTTTDNNDKNQINNSKTVTKNAVVKPENLENQNGKPQVENFVPSRDYNHNTPIDNLKTTLENTHISVQTAEQTVDVKKNKNNDLQENATKKQVTNFNPKTNLVNKQNHLRAEKSDPIYTPYLSTPYHPVFRFPHEAETVPYDATKNVDMKGNEMPPSDPATVRHFYNLGVKYFYSQNTWTNGINGQSYDNSYFMVNAPPDLNVNANIVSGPISSGENVNQFANSSNTNNGSRNNNRSSPPRNRDQETVNGSRIGGQKLNHRSNPDFRNPAASNPSPNNDINRNRNDGKNITLNEQPTTPGSNNKEVVQRGNKSNGLAPRFKRNYEAGKGRNDHNVPHQYNRQPNPQDYKKQIDGPMMPGRCDINDPGQLQHQQPPTSLPHQQQQHQQLPHMSHHQQQQQPPPMIPSQTPPPMNGAYSYPIPYNQMQYMPMAPYPAESENFPGPYYPGPPGYVQVPYIGPTSEMTEPPMYQPVDGYPAQYQPVYSQFVYPPAPAMYPNQPPPPDGCYPPYPGQPYFFSYPPPPPQMPTSLATPPTAQSAQFQADVTANEEHLIITYEHVF